MHIATSTRTELPRHSGSSAPDRTDSAGAQHTVVRGDNLSHIAARHGVSLDALKQANPQIRNPNRIYPGQQINIPQARPDGVVARSSAAPARRNTLSTGSGPQPASGGLAPDTMRASIESGMSLRRGARGPQVRDLQARLAELGHNPGPRDGLFGPRTQRALQSFQRSQNLSADGVVGPRTQQALANPQATERVADTGPGRDVPSLQVYPPNSPEAVALFREAARVAGVPESWASSPGLHNILRRESNGKVGVPNYTYGARARDPSRWGEVHNELRNGRITARSSATGLGQLLLNNVERYYPDGRRGIGNPVSEAAGMLSYIKDRYGSPERAWQLYGTRHEGY